MLKRISNEISEIMAIQLSHRFQNIEEVVSGLIAKYSISINMLFAIDYENHIIKGEGFSSDKKLSIDYEIDINPSTFEQHAGFVKYYEDGNFESISILNPIQTSENNIDDNINILYFTSSNDVYFKKFLVLPSLKGEYGNRFSSFLIEMNKCALQLNLQTTETEPCMFPAFRFFFTDVRKHELTKIIEYVLK